VVTGVGAATGAAYIVTGAATGAAYWVATGAVAITVGAPAIATDIAAQPEITRKFEDE